jgi:hypothetical protein
MPSPSSDLPPWLRRSGAAPRGSNNRAAATAAFAVLLFAAGAGSGFLYGRRGEPVAPPPPPPAPACPPPVVCAPPATGAAAPHLKLAAASKRTKMPPKTLTPLPDKAPMDEGERKQALHAFAQQKSTELRECVPEPDRGPILRVGVALEITPDGAVDMVQILGGDASPKNVTSCYANRIKRWRFPEELLRGEEKLTATFVL